MTEVMRFYRKLVALSPLTEREFNEAVLKEFQSLYQGFSDSDGRVRGCECADRGHHGFNPSIRDSLIQTIEEAFNTLAQKAGFQSLYQGFSDSDVTVVATAVWANGKVSIPLSGIL